MLVSTIRPAARLVVMVLLVVLAGGCGGETTTSAATSPAATTSTTAAPTTPTVLPMTAEELAWLKSIPTVSKKIDKTFQATTNLTTSAMTKLAKSLRACTRELAKGGSPSDRLQPVYTLVKKACKEYDKGAKCMITAARIGIPLAGSAEDKEQSKAIQCGFTAVGRGGIFLADAENKGEEIKLEVGS